MDIKVNKAELRCAVTWHTPYELSWCSDDKRLQQAAQSGSIARSVAIEVIYEQVRSLVKGQKGSKNESEGSMKVNSNHQFWRNETAEINDSIGNDNSREVSGKVTSGNQRSRDERKNICSGLLNGGHQDSIKYS